MAPLSDEERDVVMEVLKALRGLSFGYVQIVIQDSRVVQIDRTEKKRFHSPRRTGAPLNDTR
ncbi:MAG: YezD family protein [Clostridia bacterium]|nr:YezD family protein [Clostridia bacterium]